MAKRNEEMEVSKDEFKNELENAFKEVKDYREGKISLKPIEELLDE